MSCKPTMHLRNDKSSNWMICWQEYHLVHFRLSSGQPSSGILNVRLIQATPLLKPCQDEYLSHSNDKDLDPDGRTLMSAVASCLISWSPSTTFSPDGPSGHFSGTSFRNSGPLSHLFFLTTSSAAKPQVASSAGFSSVRKCCHCRVEVFSHMKERQLATKV